jgi:two-component system sensor histidine kinase UhpB
MSSARPFTRSLKRSLRAKVTLSVVLPLIIVLGTFTAIEHERRREAALDNLSFLASQTGQVIENSVLHEMLSRNLAGLQNILDSIGNTDAIQVVYLMDTSGRVVFAPEGKGVGLALNNQDETCQPCHRLPAEERPSSVVVTLQQGQRVFRSMNPIENRSQCQACHDPDERLLGLLLTDISMAPLEEPLAADLRENLLWWVATVVVTVLVVNIGTNRFVLRRLERLTSAIADWGTGRRATPISDDEPDEIGQLTSALNTMVRQVETRESENRALSESLRQQSVRRGELLRRLITAQEDERARVARELHDVLGQSLTGLSLRAEALERLIASDPDCVSEQLNQIRELSSRTTDRMYDLILDLRPSALDDLGLAAALRAHAARLLNGTEIVFELDASGMKGRLPPVIETALYRTFQEALSNVVRHASASHVKVTLIQRDGVFEGEIVDDGRGFDTGTVPIDAQSSRGLGLLGMWERITQCGGDLSVVSQPGTGTSVRIRIPLAETTCD